MNGQRKDYSLNTSAIPDNTIIDGPCPWVWKTPLRKIDFKRHNHLHGDYLKPYVDRGQLLNQCRNSIWGMRYELADSSILNLYESGLKIIFNFIDETNTKIFGIKDFTSEVIASLVFWLKNAKNSRTGETVSYVTARRRYVAIKTILSFYIRQGLFDNRLLPINPFPNVNRAAKGTESYSRAEMQSIMKLLFKELRAIRLGNSVLSQRVQLSVYLLLIIAKTGLNKSPLEDASRDSLRPHPLQPDKAWVLLTYKRRGMNTHAISLRNTREVSSMDSLPNSVAGLIQEAVAFTDGLVPEAMPEERDKIWLYRSEMTKKVKAFKGLCLSKCAHIIASHHQLKDEQDQPITISAKRLRKTFAERVWQLTGGDAWKTARLLGNTPQITDRHYLDVTPTMEKNHRFVGIALEIHARGLQQDPHAIEFFAKKTGFSAKKSAEILSGSNNTGVSRCSDPLSGSYANGDGTPCTKFLNCFRCPNQIVLEDDLYRLFSFYWLIITERSFIGRKRWKRLYGWVVREIDNQIVPNFNHRAVSDAKEKARIQPHPMWNQRNIL